MATVTVPRQQFYLALIVFVLVLLIGYGSDLILIRHPGWIVADDAILALIAAAIVFLYERERNRLLAEKLRVIRDMNAFVRNELQILYASLEHPPETSVRTIERSVERIDWALRELLPGRHVSQINPSASDIQEPRRKKAV